LAAVVVVAVCFPAASWLWELDILPRRRMASAWTRKIYCRLARANSRRKTEG